MKILKQRSVKKINSQNGSTLVEYALLICLITLTCIIVVTELGDKIKCKLLIAGLSIEHPRFAELSNSNGPQYFCENPSDDRGR